MAKKKKNDMTKSYIAMGLFILFAIIVLLIYYGSTAMDRSMQNDGYEAGEKEDPFYKKITTGNTLDDYYNDLSNNKDSAYEEYYLQKDSYNFYEQKRAYQNGVTSSLNISSDLRDLYTMFSYELSYGEAYILLEGNSAANYECEVIMNNNATRETLQNACDRIQSELDTFTTRRNEIMQNEKVQEVLKNAPVIVESNNYDE